MRRNPTKRIGTILLFSLLGLVLLWQWRNRLLINSCGKITVARGAHFSGGGGNAGISLNYTFLCNKRKYEGSTLLDKGEFYKKGESYFLNRRYFVEYYCKDPSISKLDLERTVPDTIVRIPENGWNKLPIRAKL